MNRYNPPRVVSGILPALAATLHDLGKFAQRTGLLPGTHDDIGAGLVRKEFSRLVPPDWLDDLCDTVGDHHRGNSSRRIAKVIRVADKLASARRSQDYPQDNSLTPILFQVRLKLGVSSVTSGHRLHKLALEDEKAPENPGLFPDSPPPSISSQDYKKLWDDFLVEVNKLADSGPIDSRPRFLSWLSLLRKYLTFVPAFTSHDEKEDYPDFPDTSLYDHLKTSAAIASCLAPLGADQLEALHNGETTQIVVARLVRGDFTGIQDFIYTVARPATDRTFQGVGKRLRGRSFYIALLGDVLVDWLVRKLELTAANILYAGGGRFDLIIPADSQTEAKMKTGVEDVQKWLLNEFNGKFGLELGVEDLKADDFGNIGPLCQYLDAKIAEQKQKKWRLQAADTQFFTPPGTWHHSCPACHTLEVSKEGENCRQCQEHEKLGGVLPRITHLGWLYGDDPGPKGIASVLLGDPFCVKVFLIEKGKEQVFLESLKQPQEAILYRINSSDDFIPDRSPLGTGLAFHFLANKVPIALKEIRLRNREEPTRQNDTLDFEEIAELSPGAKYLGVLMADVDHLGLIFASGLERLSLSRLSALSQAIDLFFSGWVNKLCDQVFASWKQEQDNKHEWRDKVSGLFYVAYSGGDDLLVIGPWAQTLDLAVELQKDFSRYSCHNPALTLSAGCIMVKPHFPVQRFSRLAGDAVGKAKNERSDEREARNQASIFNHLVQWTDSPGSSLGELIELAKDIGEMVKNKEVPRTLVHDIGRLYKRGFLGPNGETKPMLHPRLYYTLARRLKKETMRSLLPRLLHAEKHLPVVAAYVSLATRKE